MKERNPNNFAMTLNISVEDPDPKIAQIAKMFKEGIAIDQNNFCIIKGKELLMYALKDFHKRWVEDKTLKDDKIDKSSSVSLDNEEKFIVKKKRNFGAIEPITGR